uniref:Uncharacterized protein n=1 Tax=Paramoeba aestuarina TaxID=180227 RepID=A0A7S4NSV3_9EUKA|mmetsp:Transcript_26698/g.41631  ORF Transcript_26698/g.41631 Transcript_26698/m.41631 type:complete len:185 (+) Transcript_26698:104-658(+)
MTNVAEVYQMPLLASCAWVALFYVFVGYQRAVKYSILHKHPTFCRYKNNFDPPTESNQKIAGKLQAQLTAADRTIGNLLEQAPAFLVTLWMYSVAVDAHYGGKLGFCYVGFRSLYPFLLGRELKKNNSKRVYVATLPCYCIIFYFFSSVISSSLPGSLFPLSSGVLGCLFVFFAWAGLHLIVAS